MKKTLVAATAALMLAGAATAASATTFTGSYSASGNTGSNADSNGLPVKITDATPDYYSNSQHTWINGNEFSFNLNSVGSSQSVDLFYVSTRSDSLDGNDGTPVDFTLTFNFTKPQGAGGEVDGSTQGTSIPVYFLGHYVGDSEAGSLTWDNGGNTTINFGTFGNLLVHLDNVTFNQGWPNTGDLGSFGGLASASFTLQAPTSAVPEPMSWALMLAGFFGLGAAVRASRRQGAALTAA